MTTLSAPESPTAEEPSVALLRAAVDALVAGSAAASSVCELTELIADATPQLDRLDGWLRAAEGELSVRTAELLRQLPLVADAVLEGLLTPKAKALTALVGKIDEPALLDSQEHLLLVAAPLPADTLRRRVDHQIATHVEPDLEAAQDRAHERRSLQPSRGADGSLRGRLLLPRGSEAFLTALEPLARRADRSDQRTAGQRRADALVELCEQVLRSGDLPPA